MENNTKKSVVFEEPRFDVIHFTPADVIETSGEGGIELPPIDIDK